MNRLTMHLSEPGHRVLVAVRASRLARSSKQALKSQRLPFLFANRSVRFIFAEIARGAKLSLWSS
jgi:hypothetical protein